MEECDETLFWLEFIEDTYSIRNEKIIALKKEASELLAVFSTTKKKINWYEPQGRTLDPISGASPGELYPEIPIHCVIGISSTNKFFSTSFEKF